jgi:hypothetical protein
MMWSRMPRSPTPRNRRLRHLIHSEPGGRRGGGEEEETETTALRAVGRWGEGGGGFVRLVFSREEGEVIMGPRAVIQSVVSTTRRTDCAIIARA